MTEEIGIFAIVPIEVLQDSRLTLWQIKVLVALLSFRNKTTNLTFPSREQLSKRTGIHTANISKTTTELVSLGWLEKEGKGGFSKATRYIIRLPDVLSTVAESTTVADSTTVVESTTLTVAESTTHTVAESTTRKEQTNLTNQLTDNIGRMSPFDIFWSVYPKKVGKVLAEKSFKTSKANIKEVLVALQWQIKSEQWTSEGGKYVPNPATYLNQGRYMDEQPKASNFLAPSFLDNLDEKEVFHA